MSKHYDSKDGQIPAQALRIGDTFRCPGKIAWIFQQFVETIGGTVVKVKPGLYRVDPIA